MWAEGVAGVRTGGQAMGRLDAEEEVQRGIDAFEDSLRRTQDQVQFTVTAMRAARNRKE